MKTPLLIEQHFHGGYNVNFNTASVDDVIYLSKEILKEGIGTIFPTLVTDSVENIKQQIQIIKTAASKQTEDMAKIAGIHLEGIFLNPAKKGIHDTKYFMTPTVENFKQVEDDFIKIVTLAPEFAHKDLLDYLKEKGIKIQAGHCTGGELTCCDGVTHIFNAMAGVTHRGKSTALSALINDNLYTEIIADGVHVSDDALKLLFKSKPADKIILVSDCLPCTHSTIKEFDFAGSKIYFDGRHAASKDGTLAGSTALLTDIVKLLGKKGVFVEQFILNPYIYHDTEPKGEIEWDDDFNIINMKTF